MISNKLFFTPVRFCLLGLLAVATICSAVNLPDIPVFKPATDSFTLSEPLTILDSNNIQQNLVGLESGDLRLSFPNMPGSEAIVPADAEGVYWTFPTPKNFNRVRVQFDQRNYNFVIKQMRSYAPRLIQLLSIPSRHCNFHPFALRYYEAVVRAGTIQNAVKLTQMTPTDALSREHYVLMNLLLQRCLTDQDYAAAESVLSYLREAMPEWRYAEVAYSTADALRTSGEEDLTFKIYGSLVRAKDDAVRQQSLLWAGYSKAVIGDVTAAEAILKDVPELGREDENFLTYCLARGRLALEQGNNKEGLRYLSRAMVLTTVEATFKPELYYLLIRGYRDSGEDEAAKLLSNEFETFYPENPWLKRSQSDVNS